MKTFERWLMLGLAILLLGIGFLIYFVFPKSNTQPLLSNVVATEQAAEITSFSIEPSRRDSDWLMYSDGAKLVLTGKHITRVEFFDYPTGTGIGDLYPNGASLGVATSSEGQNGDKQWSLVLPNGLLLTNLWAVVTGEDGKTIKSSDLGSVGYQK